MNKKMLTASAVMSAAILPAFAASSAKAQLAQIYRGGAGYYDGQTGTVTALLNSSSGTSNTYIVSDGTASVLLYNIPNTVSGTSYTPTVGDNINFGAYDSPYQGAPELTSNTSNGVFTFEGLNSSGNRVAPTQVSIPTFDTAGTASTSTANPPLAEALVTIDNVSFATYPTTLATNTTYKLTDATGDYTNLYGYKSDSAVSAAIAAADAAYPAASGGFAGTFNITGYVDVYYGAPEIYPTSIVEVSSSPVPEPTSLALIGLASTALLGRRRRRQS